MGAVAKSYMRKGFLIYEEMLKLFVIQYMRRPVVIYDFATRFVVDFLIYEENFVFFFIIAASFLLASSNVPVVYCAAVLALPLTH